MTFVSRRVAFVFLFLIGLTATGKAQNGGGPFSPGFIIVGPAGREQSELLRAPAVLEELKLTEQQATRVKDILDNLDKKRREGEAVKGVANQAAPPPNQKTPIRDKEALQKRLMEIQSRAIALRLETDAAISEILDAPQRTRLSEIHLQRQGVQALLTPEVVKKLKMTDQKIAEIREILSESDMQRIRQADIMRALFAQVPRDELGRANPEIVQQLMDTPEFKEKMAKAQKAMQEASKNVESETKIQIGRILNKTQRESFKKLLGEPFDLKKLTLANAPKRETASPENSKGTTPSNSDTPGEKKTLRDRRGSTPD